MKDKIYNLQNLLRDYGVLISFSGRFSQGIIEELGDAIKSHMEAEKRPQNDIFNVFAIFIEQTQNIKNYASRKEGTEAYEKVSSSGIVTIGKHKEGYFVWSGNLIELEDMNKLAAKLDLIGSFDKDGLRKLYKEQLKKELPPESSSAGIGLIEIARKASEPISYSIDKVDDHYAFFQLRVMV